MNWGITKYLLSLLFFLFVHRTMGQKLKFSTDRGLYDAPFELVLSTTIEGGTILYTLDGSKPSVTYGSLYTEPIKITTTSVVRAIAFKESVDTTSVHTNTYIFVNEVVKQPATIPGWPNYLYSTGTTGHRAIHDYEMDPAIVNDPNYKDDLIKGLKSIPTMSIVMKKDDFWEVYDDKPGDIIREASVEIIYPNGGKSEQTDCGLKGHSWERLKRSLRLEFKKEFGPGKFESSIFKNVAWNSSQSTKSFGNILLRAGNNRAWTRTYNPDRTTFTEDEWARSSQIAISGVGVHGNFVHLYINGLYWGLYNPVERPDNKFTSSYFGGSNNDWFAVSEAKVFNGDSTRWVYMRDSLVHKNLSLNTNYEEYKRNIDVDGLIDYLMVSWMCGKTDWPQNNWWAGHNSNPSSPVKFFVWDSEWSWDTTNAANRGAWVHPQFRKTKSYGVPLVSFFNSAKRNKDFMMLLADRVYKHCFNDGQLTDANSRKRWAQINDYIQYAIIGESARWGDALDDGVLRTKNEYWTPNVKRIDLLMDGNVQRFIAALRAEGYYPAIDPPKFNKEGGVINKGFVLEITKDSSAGTIYYTYDGSDPRESGGKLSERAISYTEAFSIQGSVKIKARIKNGTTWSALHEADFKIVPSGVYINEIVASNVSGLKDNYGEFDDWIEIYNSNNFPVDIGGYCITDDPGKPSSWRISDTASNVTTISPGGYKILWADKQPEQGADHIGIKLSADGEFVGLYIVSNGDAILIDSTSYNVLGPDVSRGRLEDGDPKFVYFKVPTPDSANKVVDVTGISKKALAIGQKINVYPNPYSETFNIELLSQEEDNCSVELYDLSGKLLNKLYEGRLTNNNIQLIEDKEERLAGVYILKVNGNKLNATYRLVKR